MQADRNQWSDPIASILCRCLKYNWLDPQGKKHRKNVQKFGEVVDLNSLD